MPMIVSDPNSQRFSVALELLRQEQPLTYEDIQLQLSPDGYLDVGVASSWRIENTTERTAASDLERARTILASLLINSPDFAAAVGGHPQRFSLVYTDGRDAVLLGHFRDGEIVWAGGSAPSDP